MTTVTGTKTITSTPAAGFGGSSQLASRCFFYIKNLSDCIAIIANGRIIEPGEFEKFKPKPTESTVIMVSSTGAAVLALIQEVA